MFRAAAFALALLAAAPGWACSVVPGYRVPTTLELAERADTVLIGTVTGGNRMSPNPGRDAVRVKPTILLKGPALPASLEIPGFLEGGRMRATSSDPAELRAPNPDSMMGACTRYLFRPGMKLVLFFVREQGALSFMASPFARVSEDIRSDDARWVKAVRVYIAIAALPEGERRAALIARREALRAASDADSQAIAADIDRELNEERAPLRD